MTDPNNAPTPQTPASQPSPKSVATSPEKPPQPALPGAPKRSDGGSFAEDPRNTTLAPTSPSEQSAFPSFQETHNSQLTTHNSSSSRPRNGKIARLPKLEREMVNRMLANNLSQDRIVDALDDCGFHVTQRNVSNWKTRGGYKEWCAAQAHALELRTFQDNLTDFLRRHDAAELPEVGLQSAATSLSAIFLRPDLMRELLASPEKYSKLIELQCRLAREIQALQKNRDDATKSVGYNPERRKRDNEQEIESIRETFSSKIGKSPRDPDIPHRNFIPKEIDPAMPLTRPPDLDIFKVLQSTLAARRSNVTPPTELQPQRVAPEIVRGLAPGPDPGKP